jgi:hypothetical protein
LKKLTYVLEQKPKEISKNSKNKKESSKSWRQKTGEEIQPNQ